MKMYKLIGFQLISRNEGFNVHPLMESSFCVYSYQQIHDMHRKAGIADWIVIPVFEGDIDLPTIMYEGKLDVFVAGDKTSELFEPDSDYEVNLKNLILLFEETYPYVEGKCIESVKIQLDDLDMACLKYDKWGNVVIENEHGTYFSVQHLSGNEINIFLENIKREIEEKKKKEIEEMLFEIYSNIGIDRPENHDQILEFCFNDVNEAADPEDWHSGDVDIAFRRFLESKSKDSEY